MSVAMVPTCTRRTRSIATVGCGPTCFNGPFATLPEYLEWLVPKQSSQDPMFFAVVDQATGRATGLASYLRIDPPNGVIEVGHIAYSPLLQRTPAATETMYLMMRNAFELGYRRYEWKCHALNGPSRAAAVRLGFTFEGVFRQAIIIKGRNRDTAWYSIIDSEWPALDRAFQQWLAPENFDADGGQRVSLSQLTRVASGREGVARRCPRVQVNRVQRERVAPCAAVGFS